MGELITPEMRLVNTKFELQVDKWKFVGHPRKIHSFKDGEDTRALVFNIVFILEVGGALVGVVLEEMCFELSPMCLCPGV